MTVLRDPRFGREDFGPMGARLLRRRLGARAATDGFPRPPAHTRLRSLVSKAFTAASCRGCARTSGMATGSSIAARMPGDDVISDLAYPLPGNRDLRDARRGRPRITHHPSGPRTSLAAGRRSDCRRTAKSSSGGGSRHALGDTPHPAAGAAALAAGGPAQPPDRPPRRKETSSARTSCSPLVADFHRRHETTVNLIGNGLFALLRHPASCGGCQPNRRSSQRVEELLRYDFRCQRTARVQDEVENWRQEDPGHALVVAAIGAAIAIRSIFLIRIGSISPGAQRPCRLRFGILSALALRSPA